MITLVDYGIGNLRSVQKAFEHVGAEVLRTDDADAIRNADRLVVPGVGAFGACIGALRERRLDELIVQRAEAGVPLLGVCVGMQLLFEVGEEHGEHRGLGLLPGRVVHFRSDLEDAPGVTDRKIPHMGWNTAEVERSSPLLQGLDESPYFYFVHSYHAVADDPSDVLATTAYGRRFPAIVGRNNVYGVQFHPEKSQQSGLHLLKNFAELPVDVLSA